MGIFKSRNRVFGENCDRKLEAGVHLGVLGNRTSRLRWQLSCNWSSDSKFTQENLLKCVKISLGWSMIGEVEHSFEGLKIKSWQSRNCINKIEATWHSSCWYIILLYYMSHARWSLIALLDVSLHGKLRSVAYQHFSREISSKTFTVYAGDNMTIHHLMDNLLKPLKWLLYTYYSWQYEWILV